MHTENQYNDKNGNIIDFYSIFNIPMDAPFPDIRSAFCGLIKRYHPDKSKSTSHIDTEKIDLIVRGYKILSDEETRRNYDRHLFQKRDHRSGHYIISKKRIKYSTSLHDLLKARLHPKNMKRKDILYNFGQDIEISITPLEAKQGAVAYVELPARMTCPVCYGEDIHCHVCNGIGRISTASQLEVKIPPHVDNSTFIDVDLVKLRPDRLTNFAIKSVRIKIVVGN